MTETIERYAPRVLIVLADVTWMIAWFLLVFGWVEGNTHLMLAGCFMGMGGTVFMLWWVIDRAAAQQRLKAEDMADALIREHMRQLGPRGLG